MNHGIPKHLFLFMGTIPLAFGCSNSRPVANEGLSVVLQENTPLTRQMLSRGEQRVASCMKKAGFAYQERSATSTDKFIPVLSPGGTNYGFADSVERQLSYRDVMNKQLDSLPPPERSAYLRALYGFDTTKGPPTDNSSSGCQGESLDPRSKALLLTLGDRRQAWAERFRADRKVLALNRIWSKCMAMKGYRNLADSDAVVESILRPLSAPLYAAKVLDATLLAELRAKESKIAGADFSCGQPIDRELRQLRASFEKQFLSENASDLTNLGVALKGPAPG